MPTNAYNKKALDLAVSNIENVIAAIDHWYNEKKMSEEAYARMSRELSILWSLIDYVRGSDEPVPVYLVP